MLLSWNAIDIDIGRRDEVYTVLYRPSISSQEVALEENLLLSGVSAFSKWPASYVTFAAQQALNAVQDWSIWNFTPVLINGEYQVDMSLIVFILQLILVSLMADRNTGLIRQYRL